MKSPSLQQAPLGSPWLFLDRPKWTSPTSPSLMIYNNICLSLALFWSWSWSLTCSSRYSQVVFKYFEEFQSYGILDACPDRTILAFLFAKCHSCLKDANAMTSLIGSIIVKGRDPKKIHRKLWSFAIPPLTAPTSRPPRLIAGQAIHRKRDIIDALFVHAWT